MTERLDHALEFIKNRRALVPVSSIYVVECEGYIKIGVANDVDARVLTLQTGCPFKIRLIRSFRSQNAHEEEEAIHELLHRYHVRGEWFKVPHSMIYHLLEGKPWNCLAVESDYSI
jgi:hypothetical protein